MNKIRILHFELSEARGGIESFLYNFYSQVDRDRIQFDFVTQSDKPALGKEIELLGGQIRKISSISNIGAYIKDIKKIYQDDYDVIHFHKNSAANIIPIKIAADLNRAKIVVHSHNTSPSRGGIATILHRLNRSYVGKKAGARLACSKEAGDWMFEKYDYSIIHNGIPVDEYEYDELTRNTVRAEFDFDDDFIVGHVGRFTEQKNQTRLVEIFQELRKRNGNTKLMFVGDGPLLESTKAFVAKNGLEQSVIFTGSRNDVPRLLMAMDAFVLPSIFEGLPIVGIESQAAGVPFFVADTVSRDIELTNDVFWFSLNDTDAKIAELIIQNSQVTSEWRKQKNQDVKIAGFDARDIVKKMYAVYEL